MKRLVGMGLAVTTLVLAPSLAFADEGPPPPLPAPDATTTESGTATIDTVHLRSGGMFRGRVSEILPGDHVSVILPTGETRRFPWADVDRVIVASTTVPPPATSGSTTTTEAPPFVGPTARVHIKGSGRVTLYRRPAGSSELYAACESPCDKELPLGDTYRVGGSGLTTTKEFTLAAQPGGSVELTVDGPSWAGIITGGVLILGGGLSAYVGSLLALAGGSSSSSSRYNSYSQETRNWGIGALVVGAAAIGVGLALVYPSLKTDLSQESGGPRRDAFVRTPTWRTATAAEGSAAPPLSFSVLEGRF